MRYSYSQKRTIDTYRLDLYRGVTRRGLYDIPVLEPCRELPECGRLVAFSTILSRPATYASLSGVHFFLDDYRFERVWNDPLKWARILRNAKFVLTPDFSLYADMPLCQQIYNVYRNRLIGACFQRMGVKVIPTVSWSDARSYDFCFEGVPEGNVVAVSNIGCLKDSESRKLWHEGFEEMNGRLNPAKILLYGTKHELECENIVYFCNVNLRRMKSHGR
ncbi:MAG: DUF4417 domain-containing protein [Bacteroidales bacterium]|nr:DUF4417 domain-containing protein [Bacteroidales bacterium]